MLATEAVLLGCCFVMVLGCKRAQQPTATLAPRVTNSLGMELVLIEPGEFQMGSPAGADAEDGSQPRHRVQITKPFYMGKLEVTQDQFAQIMEMRPSHFCETGVGAAYVNGIPTGDFPVDRVTWEEAVEFCGRLSDLEAEVAAGRTYRLPTEAEWEYACRAGTTGKFSTGASISPSEANIAGEQALGRTAKVGSYPPNPWGLHDMHGNVWEWCVDGKREFSKRTVKDPRGEVSFYSCLRGGGWDYPPAHCQSDHRGVALSGYVYFGFRVVCEVD